MSWVVTVIGIIIALSILVVIHEGGHYLAARAFHVRVTEFMVGLPGPCVGITRHGTKFGITAVPLGGYARVAGMEGGDEDPLLAPALAFVNRHGSTDAAHLAAALHIDEDDASYLLTILSGWGSITTPKGTLTADVYLACERGEYAKGQPRQVDDEQALLDEERKGTYRALPWYKRLVILLAGPVFNLVAALLLFVILYSGHGVYQLSNTVEDIIDGSPAQAAGLQAGDIITAIGAYTVEDYDTLSVALDSCAPGDVVTVTFERDGEQDSVQVELDANEEGQAVIGIYLGYDLVHLSVWESVRYSFEYMGTVFKAIIGFFNPAQVAETIEQSSSVVGIAYVAHEMSGAGWAAYLLLCAAVSVSLGLFNLLPIPPLDGGRILIEVIQLIIRRDVPVRVVNIITVIGIALFALLFIVLLQQDIVRIITGGW